MKTKSVGYPLPNKTLQLDYYLNSIDFSKKKKLLIVSVYSTSGKALVVRIFFFDNKLINKTEAV